MNTSQTNTSLPENEDKLNNEKKNRLQSERKHEGTNVTTNEEADVVPASMTPEQV